MIKHFLHLTDYTTNEIWELLDLAKELKIKIIDQSELHKLLNKSS